MDEKKFVCAITDYNEAVQKGLETEPAFGKPLTQSKAFDTPPYFAIQFFPLARKNFGGIKTDLRCRVLDKHFEPITGLYGAGELCGMAGGHINGRAGLEGTMLGPSLFSGRVAGGWAANEAGFTVMGIPGPSAVTSAMSISGFEEKYFFYGFFPQKKKGYYKRFKQLI